MTIAYVLATKQRDHILKNKKSQKYILKDMCTQHFSWTVCFEDKVFKVCRMGRSDKVSLWYVALIISNKFRFFIIE